MELEKQENSVYPTPVEISRACPECQSPVGSVPKSDNLYQCIGGCGKFWKSDTKKTPPHEEVKDSLSYIENPLFGLETI